MAVLALVMLLGVARVGAARAEAPVRSIREWARCDGAADDSAGTATAFAAAAHGAFVLSVDCPLRLAIGTDIARPIFIDDGTTVRFTPAGSVTVDNLMQPAFVIADSHDIALDGWTIRYAGRIPLDPTQIPGFAAANAKRTKPSRYAITSDFNGITLTRWLTAHRGVNASAAPAEWHGPFPYFAMLLILGDASRIAITNATITGVPGTASDRFVPVAISFESQFGANSATAPVGPGPIPPGLAIPSKVSIDGLTLDYYLMGILGQVRDTTIRHVRALHYSDLQGDGVKVGAWTPPPHMIYLRSRATGALANRNLTVTDVIDRGLVVGAGRAAGGTAVSLKIGADDSIVDGYESDRPDGVLQPLTSTNLVIRNVTGHYDSRFSPQHEGAIRFVNGPYTNVRIEHVDVTDLAPAAAIPPVTGPGNRGSTGIALSDVRILTRNATPAAMAAPHFAPGSADLLDVRIGPGGGRQ